MVSHSAVFALAQNASVEEFKHWVCSKKQTCLSAFGTCFFLTGIASLLTEMYEKKKTRIDRTEKYIEGRSSVQWSPYKLDNLLMHIISAAPSNETKQI